MLCKGQTHQHEGSYVLCPKTTARYLEPEKSPAYLEKDSRWRESQRLVKHHLIAIARNLKPRNIGITRTPQVAESYRKRFLFLSNPRADFYKFDTIAISLCWICLNPTHNCHTRFCTFSLEVRFLTLYGCTDMYQNGPSLNLLHNWYASYRTRYATVEYQASSHTKIVLIWPQFCQNHLLPKPCLQ